MITEDTEDIIGYIRESLQEARGLENRDERCGYLYQTLDTVMWLLTLAKVPQ